MSEREREKRGERVSEMEGRGMSDIRCTPTTCKVLCACVALVVFAASCVKGGAVWRVVW